jgi:hypothetical protein
LDDEDDEEGRMSDRARPLAQEKAHGHCH